MDLTILKCKLHRATVTHSEPDYEGSCAIDKALLDAAGILPHEQIHIYNVSNGARIVTYAIEGELGSGLISVNGAAAHHANPDDIIIICSYAQMDEHAAATFQPKLVYLSPGNQIESTRDHIEIQAGN